MNKTILPLLYCLISFCAQGQLAPPTAPKRPVIFEEFGHQRIDNYYWMNTKTDSTVLQHIQQENAYAMTLLAPLQPLQQTLLDEMKRRQPKTLSSLPIKRNGYWYYAQLPQGKAYPTFYRRKGSLLANSELIANADSLSAGKPVFYFLPPTVSPNNQLAVFLTNATGDRRYTATVKDLATGHMLADSIKSRIASQPVWATDSRSFFYVEYNQAMLPYRVIRHQLGRPAEQDQVLFVEKDSTFEVSIAVSADYHYLFISTSSPTTGEVLYLPMDSLRSSPMLLAKRQADVDVRLIEAVNRTAYLITNYRATDYQIVQTSLDNPQKDHWQTLIRAKPDTFISVGFGTPSAKVVANKLVYTARIQGLPVILVYDLLTKQSHPITFNEQVYSVSFSVPDDSPQADSIRLAFSSYATPVVEYAYNLTTGRRTIIRRQEVPSFSPAQYETKLLQVPGRDGTLVPVSMVYHKDRYRADGSHPLLIYTYSWYGTVLNPSFTVAGGDVISLLDRGMAFVYVHARGGAEKGLAWWKAGRRLKRNNTYYDLVDAAQYLVDRHYTNPAKLVAWGKSAGGTNIGAMVNLRPDLFKAVIADVPWVDVITDMKNPNVPTVTYEYEEEGDPTIEQEYRYMLTWSPYDNIKKAVYPAILATASWNDTNVPYYHAAKWVAKLREANTGGSPILLLTNLQAGHGGQSGRFGVLQDRALRFAFLLHAVGLH